MTLLETIVAMVVASAGVLTLGGVLLSVQRQYEQSSIRGSVLQRAEAVVEEIRSSSPERLRAQFDGRTYEVSGVTGVASDGSVIAVRVDATDPRLPAVTVDASWIALGKPEDVSLETLVYSPRGQQ